MTLTRILMVAAAGLGVAVAAQQIAREALETAGPGPVLAQASGSAAAPEDASAEADEIDQMSEAEMAAELERIESEAGSSEALEEFEPSKPLAADIAIALPSDI